MAKILYLEDEEWQVKNTVITVIEKEFRHKVILVDSVPEAKDALSRDPYDVAILDIMMDPNEGIRFEDSGLYIAQLILQGEFESAGNPSTLPIIFASGVWDAPMVDAEGQTWIVEKYVRNLGIPQDRFLQKPFSPEEIHDILKRVLD